ncbi:hypothetical protein LR002_03320 [Candidatus Gracilibacteria bacterium]|nr:hypothetical protein [Candidatus Gracilibacteria bacterium]
MKKNSEKIRKANLKRVAKRKSRAVKVAKIKAEKATEQIKIVEKIMLILIKVRKINCDIFGVANKFCVNKIFKY